MFPNAYSVIITNEDGEPLGFETNYHDEAPDFDDYDDFYFDD